MNRADGIYFEQMVNQKGDGRFFQLELEASHAQNCCKMLQFIIVHSEKVDTKKW